MKTDAYTKIVLTVIAVCLSALVLQNMNLVPDAEASSGKQAATNKTVKVPVNEDGSIDVRIRGEMPQKITDVNIVRVGGNDVRKGLPVRPFEHALNINIEELGGYQVYGQLPVKMQ